MNTAAEYLVRHGRSGHLGRFRAGGDCRVVHGDEVVIRGRRGLELGEVLGPSRPDAALPDEFVGELLRVASDDDRRAVSAIVAKIPRLCAEAERLAAELALPIVVVDLELSLDERSAVLHAIRSGPIDPGPLLDRLGEECGFIVRWHDLGGEPPPPAPAEDAEEALTCGKDDCGQGNCGSTGGCSSCGAGHAHELESYFAELRAKMESRHRVRLV